MADVVPAIPRCRPQIAIQGGKRQTVDAKQTGRDAGLIVKKRRLQFACGVESVQVAVVRDPKQHVGVLAVFDVRRSASQPG